MRALIIGGNGFVGSHLVDKLRQEGAYIRVYDRREELFRERRPGVDYVIGDLGNRGLLEESLKDIEVVFHLASTTIPKTSNDDPVFDVQSNVVGSLGLFDLCRNKSIKKVVFISSGGTVYGRPKSSPIKEEHSTDPLCSYGIGKLAIEKYLQLYRLLYDLKFVILRCSNPYGERQDPLGQQGAVTVFLSRVAQSLPLEIWGDGQVVRDYFYVGDLAEALYRVARSDLEGHILNMGSGVGWSLNQILEKIKIITKKNCLVEYKPARPFDVKEMILDISAAKKLLGWTPGTSLEEGMEKTWKWLKEYFSR
jgi:UDP-glucose 4-epimerase